MFFGECLAGRLIPAADGCQPGPGHTVEQVPGVAKAVPSQTDEAEADLLPGSWSLCRWLLCGPFLSYRSICSRFILNRFIRSRRHLNPTTVHI